MRASIATLCLLVVVPGCGGDGGGKPPRPSAPAPAMEASREELPLLPDADEGSALRIARLREYCRQVQGGERVSATALAYHGQRLSWRVVVDAVQGRRVVAGVGKLRLEFNSIGAEPDFEAGDEILVQGVISQVDPARAWIRLGADTFAQPPSY
ncbi:MAG: hypothetical protein AAF628_20630 [Planctomycetota bacterium]